MTGGYSCSIQNVKSYSVVVISVESEDDLKWTGRRYNPSTSATQPPLETFLKSDWNRDIKEPPAKKYDAFDYFSKFFGNRP